jgi:DNA repair exonuclease SbcCD nuclease subunit
MKILVCGDPHLKVSTIEAARKFLDFLLQTERDVRPDLVVILGDLFDTHAVLRVEILNLWVSYLQQVRALTADPRCHVLMVGNHDKAGPAANEHALVGLARFDHVLVVDRPCTTAGMGFLPYYHTQEEFARAVRAIPADIDTLFVHNTFQGAQYENGFYDPDGFSLSLVERFSRVISGHVHKAQWVGNVYYVGSPYSFQGFQDAGEVKGLHVFEPGPDGDEWTHFKTPLPSYHVLRFSSLEAFLDGFEDATPDPADHFKVIVPADRSSVAFLASDSRFLALKGRYKILLAPEFSEAPRRQGLVQQATTLEGMVDAYVSEVLKTDLDKARLGNVARMILKGIAGV